MVPVLTELLPEKITITHALVEGSIRINASVRFLGVYLGEFLHKRVNEEEGTRETTFLKLTTYRDFTCHFTYENNISYVKMFQFHI